MNGTLRVNLLEDQSFRKDLFDVCKSLLRPEVAKVIGDVMKAEDGYLDKKIAEWLARYDIKELVLAQLRSTWENSSLCQEIRTYVDRKVDAALTKIAKSEVAVVRNEINAAVRAELARCFNPR